jgi:hypothetical protein
MCNIIGPFIWISRHRSSEGGLEENGNHEGLVNSKTGTCICQTTSSICIECCKSKESARYHIIIEVSKRICCELAFTVYTSELCWTKISQLSYIIARYSTDGFTWVLKARCL